MRLVVIEFIDYAVILWDQLVTNRKINFKSQVETQEELKVLMRKRFILLHYYRDINKKIQNLKQDSQSVEDYQNLHRRLHLHREIIIQNNNDSSQGISYFFFSNDLFLFGEASLARGRIMESVLCSFCAESGQKVHPSKLFVSLKAGFHLATANSQRFKIPQTRDLGIYLRVPLLHSRVGIKTYDFLMD